MTYASRLLSHAASLVSRPLLCSVALVRSGHLAATLHGAPLHRRLDGGEYRTLKRRGRQDLFPAPLHIGGVRSVLFARDQLPRALEQGPGDHSADHAQPEAHQPVEQFLHRRLITHTIQAAPSSTATPAATASGTRCWSALRAAFAALPRSCCPAVPALSATLLVTSPVLWVTLLVTSPVLLVTLPVTSPAVAETRSFMRPADSRSCALGSSFAVNASTVCPTCARVCLMSSASSCGSSGMSARAGAGVRGLFTGLLAFPACSFAVIAAPFP